MILLNKWVYSIFSNRSLFFSAQLRLNIPVFELNNCFVFRQNWDIQSILEFLQLIRDFLTSGIKVRSFVYKFSLFRIDVYLRGLMDSALCFDIAAEDSRAHSIPVVLVVLGINVKPTNQIVCIMYWNFSWFIFDFYEVWAYSNNSSLSVVF